MNALVIRPGVSAVIPKGEEILLQLRDDNRKWGLPGGSVEPGEKVLDALVREVREETGLTIEPVRLIGIYSDPKEHQVHTYPDGNVVHFVSNCFECRVLSGNLSSCEESLELAWFRPEALPKETMPVVSIRVKDWLARAQIPFIR